MNATREDFANFFESLVWSDIKTLLKEAEDRGLAELKSFEVNDLNKLNYVRGKLAGLAEVQSLEELVEDVFKYEDEERRMKDGDEDYSAETE